MRSEEGFAYATVKKGEAESQKGKRAIRERGLEGEVAGIAEE
jgi:hypothetical protein